jgi:ATP-dependent DNA helicase RecG
MGLDRKISFGTTPQEARTKPKASPSKPARASAQNGQTVPKKPRRSPSEVFGFDDPRQWLLCVPKGYVDCTNFSNSLANTEADYEAVFKLTLSGEIRGYNGKQPAWVCFAAVGRGLPEFSAMEAVPKGLVYKTDRIEMDASDDAGEKCVISIFTPGGSWAWMETKKNRVMHVVGSWKQFGHKRYFSIKENVPADAIGKIWTRYGNMASLVKASKVNEMVVAAQKDASSWRHCATKLIGECGLEEQTILSKVGAPFESLIDMLKGLHDPREINEGKAALECAHRISALAMQANALMQTARNPHPKAPILVDMSFVARMASSQKETLTEDQSKVITRLCQMFGSPKAFSALLSGDVGTGKTLAYLVPAIAAHQAGAQVAIMAPTQLLADQLFGQLQSRFGQEIRGVQRIEAGDTIRDPKEILVGTSGLVSVAKKSAWIPNFVVCDEQHKMSSQVKDGMLAAWTHVLHVSATPIPRALATALYDGMEILNLRQSPVSKKIHSYVVGMEMRQSIQRAIKEAVESGERCAIVYPAVRVASEPEEETESLDIREVEHTVESAFAAFDKAYPGKVVMLHGGMDTQDIRINIDRMRKGDAQIMIASTVIETGIDIPSVSVMVVRNADCFGISQLHQLRGRLVRNGGEGDFIMAVEKLDDISPKTRERLDAIVSTNDGYELAERDLLQRGMGDFSGNSQTGASKTVFRQVTLKVTDFMSRKLKAVQVEAKEIAAMPMPAQSSERQNSLFG